MANILVTTNDFDLNTPIDASDVLVPETNVSNITAGLTQQDYYDSLLFARGYNKSCGSSGSPLRTLTKVLRYYGGGALYFQADDGGPGAGSELMDDVYIEAERFDVPVVLSQAAATHADCDWTMIRIGRGSVDIGAALTWTATVGRVDVGFVSDVRGDSRVKIANGNTLPILTMSGGTVVCETAVTRATVCSGHLTVDVAAIAMLELNNGAHCDYNHASITDIVVNSGASLDLTRMSKKQTISGKIILMPGSSYRSDLENLTGTVLDLRRQAA